MNEDKDEIEFSYEVFDRQQNFIDTNSKQLNEFDEHLVRQLIKKITIQETYCEVEFQNGDSIRINL